MRPQSALGEGDRERLGQESPRQPAERSRQWYCWSVVREGLVVLLVAFTAGCGGVSRADDRAGSDGGQPDAIPDGASAPGPTRGTHIALGG
jgi:hypothetical protein